LIAVKNNGPALEYVPNKFKTYEVCYEAVKHNSDALSKIPNRFKTYELYLEAAKNDGTFMGTILYDIPVISRTPELCLEAVKANPLAIMEIPSDILTSEMCLIAAKKLDYCIDWLVTDEAAVAKIKRARSGEIF
jgi:hypothetical protein